MLFRDVLDIAMVLVTEVYQELGIKSEQAHDEIQSRIGGPERKPASREPDNEASMAMLMGMMGGTDFGGPRRV